MTTSTSSLGLTTYSAVTDASSLFSAYVETTSGSDSGSNMQKIDAFAAGVKSGSYVVLALNSALTNEWLLTEGAGISIVQSASASTVTITNTVSATIASASTVTAGVDNSDTVSASALAHSDYGQRMVVVPLNGVSSDSLVGTESNYVPIPANMNAWKLVAVDAYCSASSTSGSPSFLVKSGNEQSSSGSQTMLTVNPVIGEGSFYNGSGTGSVPAAVTPAYQTVYTGWKVWVLSAGSALCGTGVKGAYIGLTFQNLP